MIKPSVGRVVWFHPGPMFSGCVLSDGSPLAALIACVWSDTCVNLGGFDANGVPFNATSVLLLQDETPRPPDGYYAEWMPYQLGQAAKTEQAVAALQTKE